MKIKLYEKDEFPIEYDTITKEIVCVGACMQCPLYIENHDLIEKNILDCFEIIEGKINKNS